MIINDNTVAICMTTYNGAQYLKEQLDSILKQTYDNWVIFIRDDGSQDGTMDIIRRYEQQHNDRIVVITDPSLAGGSAKQNFASVLAWVCGKHDFFYFMFADQDDVWLDTKIEKSLHLMWQKEPCGLPLLVHTDLHIWKNSLPGGAYHFVPAACQQCCGCNTGKLCLFCYQTSAWK